MGLVRDGNGQYAVQGTALESDVLQAAEQIFASRLLRRGPALEKPQDVVTFVRDRFAFLPNEECHVVFLDGLHRVIDVELLVRGSMAMACVQPREIVATALRLNASAALFVHCRPRGLFVGGITDRSMTSDLRKALAFVDVHVLDHVVVTAGECLSFAKAGLL